MLLGGLLRCCELLPGAELASGSGPGWSWGGTLGLRPKLLRLELRHLLSQPRLHNPTLSALCNAAGIVYAKLCSRLVIFW